MTLEVMRVLGLLLAAAASLAAQGSDVEAGWQLFRAHCAVCHGLDGAAAPAADLRRGQFRRGSSYEDLFRTISNGIPGTPMPGMNFTGYQLRGGAGAGPAHR